MRPFLIALVVALVAATSAVAKPEVHPAEPFFAATPRADSVVLRQRPGGRALATVRGHTEYGSLQTVGVTEARGNWVAVISDRTPERRPRLGAAEGTQPAPGRVVGLDLPPRPTGSS